MENNERVKILLVDDLKDNLIALEGLLRRDDLEIIKAKSGTEALECIMLHEFALALVDVQMPVMTGFELAVLMRGTKKSKSIPIIFVTATAKDQSFSFKGYESGAVDFLLKPLDAHTVKSKVNIFIELYQNKIELQKAYKALDVERVEHNTVLTTRLEEREVLLREIHHRVKNNLNIVSSLLELQADTIVDEKALEAFRQSQNRIRSIALLHEKLYLTTDLAKIEFGGYIKELVGIVFNTFGIEPSECSLIFEVEKVKISIDNAIPCSLIINELVMNSLKYAFPKDKFGEIKIGLKYTAQGKLELSLSDNGVGFPKEIDFRTTKSLGLRLVNTLVKQLNGEIELLSEKGTNFKINFSETL